MDVLCMYLEMSRLLTIMFDYADIQFYNQLI